MLLKTRKTKEDRHTTVGPIILLHGNRLTEHCHHLILLYENDAATKSIIQGVHQIIQGERASQLHFILLRNGRENVVTDNLLWRHVMTLIQTKGRRLRERDRRIVTILLSLKHHYYQHEKLVSKHPSRYRKKPLSSFKKCLGRLSCVIVSYIRGLKMNLVSTRMTWNDAIGNDVPCCLY